MADLTPYVPRLLLQWEERFGSTKHQAIDGTLVFADVSGFTRLSEALARKSGKAGAEEMADVINYLFGELLMLAAVRGGEMLKYGGDAMLLFFSGEQHAVRAAAACADMQRRLREIGRVDTGGAGIVRLRMSVGAHSGAFDFFVGGRCHRELVVAGPATTTTVDMEAAADATEVLMSPQMAAQLPSRNVGAGKDGGFLLRGNPRAPLVATAPLESDVDAATFLCSSVAAHASSERAAPEHRLATVAFLQFMDLDRLLRSGRAADAAQRVDDVLTLVEESLLEFDVTFLATDLAGDGGKVMAAAGAPIAHGDDEERMLRACRRIVDAAPPLPVRIGVNRGHVFAGDVGPRFRRTYTTLGDVTNTAARVMGKAAAGQVLALTSVLGAATSRYEVEHVEPFVAKGKSEPLCPVAVGVRREQRPRGEVVAFAGREGEVAQLRSMLPPTARASAVVLGEPGIGKSSLVDAALERSDAPRISVTCDAIESTSPFATVAALLDAAGMGRAALADVRARDKDEATRAIADLVTAAIPSGTVVVIDDAHACDDASGAVLDLVATSRDTAVLWICVRRPGEGGWMPAAATVIELGDLDAAATTGVLASLVARPLLPEDADALVRRSRGNPLFLRELAAAFDRGLPVETLPDRVEALVAARIDELDTDARHLLRTAAVLGVAPDEEVLAALVGSDATTLRERLGSAAFRHFFAIDGSCAFAHPLYQETAYAGLAFSERRRLHLRVASALQERGAPDAVLSHHFYEAGDLGSTWRYSFSAGVAALAQYAPNEAASCFRRALDVAPRLSPRPDDLPAAWSGLGRAVQMLGRNTDAVAAFRTFRRAARTARDRAFSLVLEAEALVALGSFDKAWKRFVDARRLAGADDELIDIAVKSTLGQALIKYRGSDFLLMEQLALAAVDAASRFEDADDRDHRLLLGSALAAVYMAQTRLRRPERDAAARRAVAIFTAEGDRRRAADLVNEMAIDAHLGGMLDHAIDLYRQALDAYEEIGEVVEAATSRHNIGEAQIEQGRLDEAVENLTATRAILAAAGSPIAILSALYLATAVARLGRLDEAAALLRAAIEDAERAGIDSFVDEGLLRLAELHLLRSRADLALAVLDAHPERAGAIGNRLVGCARALSGDLAGACDALRESLAAAVSEESAAAELAARVLLGRLGGCDAGDEVAISQLERRMGVVSTPIWPLGRAFAVT